jgi:hypothetical protein
MHGSPATTQSVRESPNQLNGVESLPATGANAIVGAPAASAICSADSAMLRVLPSAPSTRTLRRVCDPPYRCTGGHFVCARRGRKVGGGVTNSVTKPDGHESSHQTRGASTPGSLPRAHRGDAQRRCRRARRHVRAERWMELTQFGDADALDGVSEGHRARLRLRVEGCSSQGASEATSNGRGGLAQHRTVPPVAVQATARRRGGRPAPLRRWRRRCFGSPAVAHRRASGSAQRRHGQRQHRSGGGLPSTGKGATFPHPGHRYCASGSRMTVGSAFTIGFAAGRRGEAAPYWPGAHRPQSRRSPWSLEWKPHVGRSQPWQVPIA